MTMKRFFCFLLTVTLLLCSLCLPALAIDLPRVVFDPEPEPEPEVVLPEKFEGFAGYPLPSVRWNYQPETCVLTISGNGFMWDFALPDRMTDKDANQPWQSFASQIKEVRVESGITEVGKGAFYACTSLERVVLADTVTKIGESAFAHCTSLSVIDLSDGIKEISANAFSNTALTELKLPDSVTIIGLSAFCNCGALTTVYLPDSLEILSAGAFSDCLSLERVHISSGTRGVTARAFTNCPVLNLFTLDSDNELYSVKDDLLYSKDYEELIYCPPALCEGTFTVPDGIKIIGASVFSDRLQLTAVNLPDSLVTIKNRAFAYCSIRSIDIPASVETIGDEAFYGCRALSEVFIRGKQTAVGKNAFKISYYTAYVYPDSPAAEYFLQNDFADRGRLCLLDNELGFVDVTKTAWSFEGIEYAVQNGLFNGVDKMHFAPSKEMSRAMLVTVLWRMSGSPTPQTDKMPFLDVNAKRYYYDAVLWAAENNIVKGVTSTAFDPDASVTREQLTAILYRYAVLEEMDTSKIADLDLFPDADSISAYAKESLAWANATGLITGTNNSGVLLLDPKGASTRAQVATVLMRFAQAEEPTDENPTEIDDLPTATTSAKQMTVKFE